MQLIYSTLGSEGRYEKEKIQRRTRVKFFLFLSHLRNRCFSSFTNTSKLASERASPGTCKFAAVRGLPQARKKHVKRFYSSYKVTCPIDTFSDFTNANCVSSSTSEGLNILCYR